jgi:hypothetical protein
MNILIVNISNLIITSLFIHTFLIKKIQIRIIQGFNNMYNIF